MSARRHPFRRALLVGGVAVALVLLTSELAVRVLAPYLPEPRLWGDEATQVKVEQMDARSGQCTDLVIAGNSMGRDAFVPSLFEATDPEHRRVYNASLDAATPPLLERWLDEEVVPRLRPATVVLTLASLDVNARSRAGQSARESYDAAPLSKPGLVGRSEAAAIRTSALLQHRQELRQPSVVWEALDRARRSERPVGGTAESGVLGPDGEGRSRRALHYSGNAASQSFLTGQLLNDYSVDQGLFRAEADLIGSLQQQGIDVVLVVLPVTDDYRALHPGGAGQFDTFLDEARVLAAQRRVPLLDLHAGRPLAEFADTHHLNEAGAAQFSSRLPALLAEHGIDARRCRP